MQARPRTEGAAAELSIQLLLTYYPPDRSRRTIGHRWAMTFIPT
jgi:hypothetical protein